MEWRYSLVIFKSQSKIVISPTEIIFINRYLTYRELNNGSIFLINVSTMSRLQYENEYMYKSYIQKRGL